MSLYDYGQYFDPGYYLQNNPDVKAAGVDPRAHYDQFGWHEGRNPSVYFDTSDYLSDYGDVNQAGVNPLQHYLQFGIGEGRHPIGGTSPLFDPNYYNTQNPDVKAAGVDPATHYSTYGYLEGRDPSASFDTSSYYRDYGDVARAGAVPLEHYGTFGASEGRQYHPSGYDNGTVLVGVGLPGSGGDAGGGGVNYPPPATPPPTTLPPASPLPSPNGSRQTLMDAARGSITNLFNTRGASASKYNTDIENRIARTMAGIQDSDLGDEGLFTGVGEQLYNELQTGYRNKAVGEFNARLGSNTSLLDDPMIGTILSEQRDPADRFISNMLTRGQIDDFGAGRARSELDRQQAIGSTNLNTLGSGLIDTGLKSSRGTLSNLGLDTPYDTEATSNDFMFGLGNQLRSGAGNIFSTAGLPAVAGAQGGPFTSNKTPFKAKGGGGRTPGGELSMEDTTNVLF